jgi:REP element-mobilizing transposase RayT
VAQVLLTWPLMFHYVARTIARRRIFADDLQAATFWFALTGAFPDLIALCVVPDHLHLLLPGNDDLRRLGAVLSGHARRLRGASLWQSSPPPVALPNAQHARRTLRYVLLNPCRAGLVNDPLAWPWSTHRDRVGLAVPSIGPRERSPDAFHQLVSGDPSCAVAGTPFPSVASTARCVEDVFDAVSAVARCHPRALERRGPERTLALRSIRVLLPNEYPVAARALHLSADQTTRLLRIEKDLVLPKDRGVLAVCRVVGDPRFRALRASLGPARPR